MSTRLAVLSDPSAWPELRDGWNRLVHDHPAPEQGLDGTSLYEWFDATTRSLARDSEVHVICSRSGGEIEAVLPLAARRGGPRRELQLTSSFYAGRTGLLLRQPDARLLCRLLDGIEQVAPGWQRLSAIVVAGGPSDQVLQTLPEHSGYRVLRGDALTSPVFPIGDSAADFRAQMSKNLHQALQNARSRIRAAGGYEVQTFDSEDTALQLLEHVVEVDRQSWKEAARTSITANAQQMDFYREALPRLAGAGVLLGQVLLHQGRPAAYNFGLVRNGVYSCLKLSYVQALERLRPGHLLTSELIGHLRDRGVKVFDFMGTPDSYKLQWSRVSHLYHRHPVTIFNRSPAARGAYWLALTRRLSRGAVARWRRAERHTET